MIFYLLWPPISNRVELDHVPNLTERFYFIFCLIRLMPSRSLTDLTLASHLLSPLSLSPSCPTSDADGSDVDEVAGGGSGGGGVSDRCGRRIFQFGRPSSSSSSSSSSLGDVEAPPGGRHLLHPLASLQTTPRVKIAAKPDRIMAAPGTFLQYGLYALIQPMTGL